MRQVRIALSGIKALRSQRIAIHSLARMCVKWPASVSAGYVDTIEP